MGGPAEGSFSSFRAYGSALARTPARFTQRAGAVSTVLEEMTRNRARSGSAMQRRLRWPDLIGLGLGGMVGAGVFVTIGSAAGLKAGPGVVLSFAISGICALLSAFCYTEFAVEMPVAGGAFSYLRVTFGEFAAFLVGANLIMEYVVSNAAVARSFTSYVAAIFGKSSPTTWKIPVSTLPEGYRNIDLIAVGIILIITVGICYGTKESSLLNMVLTVVHICLIVFIIIIGFAKGSVSNLIHPKNRANHSGFLPFGMSGVLSGAAMVYMSYIGYDAVSTMAEEVKTPARDIPIGVSGSVVAVTLLYCLMAVSLSMLVPYDAIVVDAPYSTAFLGMECWRWVSNLVGVGASLGILTSLLVSMLGQARYLCVIGRSDVVPRWFARIHPKTGTPLNASVFLGICTALIAVFTDLSVLLDLVSIATLFVFFMVANAVVYRRYVADGKSDDMWKTLAFLLAFFAVSVAFTLTWQLWHNGLVRNCILAGLGIAAILVLQIFQCTVAQARKPEFWGVPLMPWIPGVAAFLNIFLLGSMSRPSYVRFECFSAIIVAMYLLYGVHASYDAVDAQEFPPSFELAEDHHVVSAAACVGGSNPGGGDSRI